MKPFLVEWSGHVIRLLSKISFFEIILKTFFSERTKETNGALTELWVIGNLLLAVVLLIIAPLDLSLVRMIVQIYALIRIAEVVIFQFSSQIYGIYRDEQRLHYTVLSYRRSIILALIIYCEVIVWFAVLYRANNSEFSTTGIALSDWIKALYYSTVTMTTIGYGDIYAKSDRAYALVIAQGIIAVFMTILIIARIISYWPKPKTLDPLEKDPPL